MKIDGVFQGGGVKGIALVGAIYRLEESNVQWQRVAGTSVGALVASLIAVGYTGREMKELMHKLDCNKVKDNNHIKNFNLVNKSFKIIMKKGIYGTSYIEKYLNSLYENKGKTKFKDLYNNGKFKLKIIASNVTNKELLILPDDIKRYGIDPMEFEIAKAVVMSISIPFFFEPVKLNYKGNQCFIVDGGITSNYPIWIFDVKGRPRWPTIGFKFEKPERKFLFNQCKNSFFSYALDVIDTTLGSYDEVLLSEENKDRTISIPTLGISAIDFNISNKMKKELFNCGYEKADDFLKRWDFGKHIRKYRK